MDNKPRASTLWPRLFNVRTILLIVGIGLVMVGIRLNTPTPDTNVELQPSPSTTAVATATPTPTPTPTVPSASASTPSPAKVRVTASKVPAKAAATRTPATTPRVQACSTASGPIVPATLSAAALSRTLPVDAQPLEAGALPVPIGSNGTYLPFAATWWNGSPMPGQPGVADLTVHTYHMGGAAGNELAAGTRVGQVITLADRAGRKLCFTVTEVKLDWPVNALPNAQLYAHGGPSQIAIVFCMGYNRATQVWTERGIVFATLTK